jgi:hypothetical protein
VLGEACTLTVELGTQIGRARVEQTPPRHAIAPDDVVRSTEATLAGESLCF